MRVANIHEAKTHLSRLIESVMAGEEVVIAKAGKPLVKLIPYETTSKVRQTGGWEGKVSMSADFDDELPADLMMGFLGEEE